MTFYSFLFLFFAYSFLGWVGEVLYTAVTRRRYQDRGVLSGPLCILYGIGAHLISFALRDLSNDSWFFLAVFSAVYATVIEWVAGHILERTSHIRWWDYSDMPFNLDGYVCLGASALWGVLGVVAVKWGNPLLLALYGLLPHRLIAIILWAALVIFAIDAVGTLLAMLGLRYHWAAGAEIENRLANFTVNTGMALLGWVEQRMNKAHPALTFRRQRRAKSTTFAEGCSPYKIILLFFIGAFLGDITETIFCRITAGYWMSRSSVVWGPFSIVWGLAIAAVTQLLYRYKDRPASWLFVAGTLLGGAYINNFTRFGKLYQTYIQAAPDYRLDRRSLDSYYVTSASGESVPVASLIDVADTVGVEYVSQFNLYRSVSLTVTPAARASTTTVMQDITRTAAQVLPDDVGTAWSGTSFQEANASKTGGLVYLLALVFVFLALAALYESWGLPLAILMSVPVAVLGAVLWSI